MGLNFCERCSLKNDVQSFYYKHQKIGLKNSLQPSKISQTVFEIAYLLAWNFRNKFRNSFKPNDRQFFSKNANFFPKFFLGQF
jgi:hypothetical protein